MRARRATASIVVPRRPLARNSARGPGAMLVVGVAVAGVAAFVLSSAHYSLTAPLKRRALGDATPGRGAVAPVEVVLELVRPVVVAVAFGWIAAQAGLIGLPGGIGLAVVLWAAFPVVLLVGSVTRGGVAPVTAAIHAGDLLLKLLLVALAVGLLHRGTRGSRALGAPVSGYALPRARTRSRPLARPGQPLPNSARATSAARQSSAARSFSASNGRPRIVHRCWACRQVSLRDASSARPLASSRECASAASLASRAICAVSACTTACSAGPGPRPSSVHTLTTAGGRSKETSACAPASAVRAGSPGPPSQRVRRTCHTRGVPLPLAWARTARR